MKYSDLLEQAEQKINLETNPQLSVALTGVLSDSFVFFYKAISFHWNVTGKDFPQLHDFFSKVYEGVFSNIDKLAEEIRALDAPAPMNLASLVAKSKLTENNNALSGMDMVAALAADNKKILAGLLACAKMAEAADEIGLNDFLTSLYDEHKKFGWMFDSILKG